MPISEFKCDRGHVTEMLFLTFKAAGKVNKIGCPECAKGRRLGVAEKIISIPGLPILYGDGFSRPAASGKNQTVGRDVTKVIAEENIKVTTQDGVQFGRPHLEKAKRISKQIRRSRRN